MAREKISVIQKSSPKFPKRLAEIPDFPKKLFCRGNTDLLTSECFAVVGTRKMTSYGRQAVGHLVPSLVRAGFTIVSGLALGVDAAAHESTLDVGGPTIAVLGSGVNNECIGPRSNFKLAMRILDQGGLIISEYESGDPAFKGSFPMRNRIISGLSVGTLVIEADEKSGSLITGRLAAEQNRDVFAVPGNIFSPLARGTNWLLKQGAKLVTAPDDILFGYGLTGENSPHKTVNLSDPVQKAILASLSERGILSADEIISTCGINASELNVALAMLEIQGHII
ncbi:MAG: DNA-processing protein DprA, partial [Patescibacteria group bacterium]